MGTFNDFYFICQIHYNNCNFNHKLWVINDTLSHTANLVTPAIFNQFFIDRKILLYTCAFFILILSPHGRARLIILLNCLIICWPQTVLWLPTTLSIWQTISVNLCFQSKSQQVVHKSYQLGRKYLSCCW